MNSKTYIQIMTNALIKKNVVLDKLIEITLLQEVQMSGQAPDIDIFDHTLSEKELLIEELNQLDDGFEKIYDRVKEEISTNKNEHKEQILTLQELIKQLTEKSAKLQITELRNKSKIESYFSIKKKEIKNFKMSSQTASNYYKNMAYQHQGESYFLDKKN